MREGGTFERDAFDVLFFERCGDAGGMGKQLQILLGVGAHAPAQGVFDVWRLRIAGRCVCEDRREAVVAGGVEK
jgi:hypothetical protein